MTKFNNTPLRATLAILLSLSMAGCNIAPVPFGAQSTSQSPKTEPVRNDSPSSTVATNEPTKKETGVQEVLDGAESSETMGLAAESTYMPVDNTVYNTEEYGKVEETGFVAASTSPLSTISADVDTASYANLRRMLKDGFRVGDAAKDESEKKDAGGDVEIIEDYGEGYSSVERKVIPTGAVRLEEMVNYFDYQYQTPKEGDDFAITAKVGPCPWNKDTQLLVLGYATANEDASIRQKGANLVFLIDVSGSMATPAKLPLLQKSFAKLVEGLGENDRVSIVTYSGEEKVVLENESGSNKDKILEAINSLKAHGSTNGEAGMRTAYDIAKKHFVEGGVNRIVMASDGDLNVGMTSESDLHDFVEGKRAEGVYLSVLGFGAGNYKDTKMETLADHGNGSYHYIDCEDEAKRVFEQRIMANLVPFADDVKVQLEFNPAQVKAYRLIGYENRSMAAEDFKNDQKDAGEVGPNSQFTVAYEIVRPDSAMKIDVPELKYGQGEGKDGASTDWVTAKLRYKQAGKSDAKEQELAISEKDWSNDPGDDWRFVAAVTEFGMLLRNSEFKGSSSYDGIRGLVGSPKDQLRIEFLELVGLAEKN